MYNRYVPGSGGYTRVTVEENVEPPTQPKRERPGTGKAREAQRKRAFPFDLFDQEDKNAGIAGILKSFHLEDLDSGDVLLLLIILLVFLEGDNTELVITLGLMLLLGVGDSDKERQNE